MSTDRRNYDGTYVALTGAAYFFLGMAFGIAISL